MYLQYTVINEDTYVVIYIGQHGLTNVKPLDVTDDIINHWFIQ